MADIENVEYKNLKDIANMDAVEFLENFLEIRLHPYQKLYMKMLGIKQGDLGNYFPVYIRCGVKHYHKIKEKEIPSPYTWWHERFYGDRIE